MNNSQPAEDPLVSVLIPSRHLMAVYAFVAGLDAGAGAADVSGDAGMEVTWPSDDLHRFAVTPTKTSSTIGKVLDVLAERAGEWLSTSELEIETGVPRANLKGAFSALTRHIKAHYGDRGWMLSWTWGPSLDPTNPAEAHYTLSDEQARRWKEVRAAG